MSEQESLAKLSSLAEPVRRSLYAFVLAEGPDVSRDRAAVGAGISRSLAAFHLDKLVADGLLDVSYKRLSGKTGPGSGRPSKLYSRSSTPVAFSAPPQNYDLMARVLTSSISGKPSEEAARAAARRHGIEIGKEARRRAGKASSARALSGRLFEVLRENGYEPAKSKGQIRLRNCPFDALANDYRDVVCGLNLALQKGVLTGLGSGAIEASFEPAPGACCVAFRTKAAR